MKSSERLAVLPADTTTPADPHYNDTEAGFFARGIEEETNPRFDLHHEAITPRRHGPSPMLITAAIVALLAVIFVCLR
jgi:hypothetical protein